MKTKSAARYGNQVVKSLVGQRGAGDRGLGEVVDQLDEHLQPLRACACRPPRMISHRAEDRDHRREHQVDAPALLIDRSSHENGSISTLRDRAGTPRSGRPSARRRPRPAPAASTRIDERPAAPGQREARRERFTTDAPTGCAAALGVEQAAGREVGGVEARRTGWRPGRPTSSPAKCARRGSGRSSRPRPASGRRRRRRPTATVWGRPMMNLLALHWIAICATNRKAPSAHAS